MKIRKLDVRGFSHHALMALIVVVVAVGGTYYLVASHADACPTPISGAVSGSNTNGNTVSTPVTPAASDTSGAVSSGSATSCPVVGSPVRPVSAPVSSAPDFADYLTVSASSVTSTLSRSNSSNVPGGMIYGTGITLTGVQNTDFELVSINATQGVGFYTTSGGLSAKQSINIPTYINPNKTNGTYAGTYSLKFYDPSTQAWYPALDISYNITLVNSLSTDYITVTNPNTDIKMVNNKTRVQLVGDTTIKAVQNAVYQIVGTKTNTGFSYNNALVTLLKGKSAVSQVVILPNRPNAFYTGTAVVKYLAKGSWQNGPTITYGINLVQ